jgi:hypothetical protein
MDGNWDLDFFCRSAQFIHEIILEILLPPSNKLLTFYSPQKEHHKPTRTMLLAAAKKKEKEQEELERKAKIDRDNEEARKRAKELAAIAKKVTPLATSTPSVAPSPPVPTIGSHSIGTPSMSQEYTEEDQNTVEIPMPTSRKTFEEAFQEYVEEDPDSVVDDILDKTTMEFTGRDIAFLEGLELFSGLTELDLSNNLIGKSQQEYNLSLT